MLIKGFYTGCVQSGNMGDDILFEIYIQMLAEAIRQKYQVNCEVVKKIFSCSPKWIEESQIGVVGGGSIIHPEEISYTIPIKNYKQAVSMMFGTGISDSPNFKIPEINRQKIIKGDYSNIGFKHNDCMRYNIEASKASSCGGLRGPMDVAIAKQIMRSYNKSYIYDAGLLAAKYIKYNPLPANDKMIGINFAAVTGDNRISILGESYEEYTQRLELILVNFCQYALDLGYTLFFYSMSLGEITLNKKIIDQLNINDSSKVICHEEELTPSDLLSLVSQFKIAIATRLHANVLINSLNIPSINLMYNCKAINYMDSVGMRPYGIPTNQELTLNKLIEVFNNLINNYSLENTLEHHINKANDLYHIHFQKMLDIGKFRIKKNVLLEYFILNPMMGIYQIN